MKSQILVGYELVTNYALRLVEDLSEPDFFHQPAGVTNHPAWLLGHLCFSFQAIGGEIGVAPWLPEDWGQTFGTGSSPSSNAANYPSGASLVETFANASEKISRAIEAMTDEALLAPLPDEGYRQTLPTVAHALTHILIGHASVHVGQLTVWRAANKLPRVAEHFDKS